MVYIGADHRGFKLKEEVKKWLTEVEDVGEFGYDPRDNYSEIAIRLGERVIRERRMGILICGSGIGVCMAVNKVKGVRAGIGINEKQVRTAREDDDMNILCLAADWTSEEEAKKMIKVFLETKFSSEEKYIKRINWIKNYETKNG